MSRLALTRSKIYRTVARQLHGVVPCWMCGQHVTLAEATLEHIQALADGGNSHLDNLAISHAACNHQRHASRARPQPGDGVAATGSAGSAGNASEGTCSMPVPGSQSP